MASHDQTDPTSAPGFDANGQLHAPRYGDGYFSAQDGLSETEHVFLNGNRLAERFSAIAPGDAGTPFTIAETGFGTGLNFLATWRHFEQHATTGSSLRFVSVEKHPLNADVIRRALSPWPALSAYRDSLLSGYGEIGEGRHGYLFASGKVELILRVGEAASVLADCHEPIDAWFLDGFAPSRNPAMWSDAVFAEVARLSRPGTTLATFTAAGFVRRGLAAAGFEVEKRPGFGTKRDMTAGRMPGVMPTSQGKTDPVLDVLVIGAGVAGSFTARALAERGMKVTVLERQPLVDGQWPTLRTRVALVQPKINHIDDPQGRFLRDGFACIQRQLQGPLGEDPRVGWWPCGVFHAKTGDHSATRLDRFIKQFGETGMGRPVAVEETHDALGVSLGVEGVLVESGGLLRPGGLCAWLLDHPQITVHPRTHVTALAQTDGVWEIHTETGERYRAYSVVVANAADAKRLKPTAHLPLSRVRGQASLIPQANLTLDGTLGRALCFGGYLTPAVDGSHTLGASFVHDDENADWRDSEHHGVCDRLSDILPDIAAALRQTVTTGWVGFRCTTPRRRPIVGPLQPDESANPDAQHPRLYVSLGHGSHGITSAAMSAQRLVELMTDGHAEA